MPIALSEMERMMVESFCEMSISGENGCTLSAWSNKVGMTDLTNGFNHFKY